MSAVKRWKPSLKGFLRCASWPWRHRNIRRFLNGVWCEWHRLTAGENVKLTPTYCCYLSMMRSEGDIMSEPASPPSSSVPSLSVLTPEHLLEPPRAPTWSRPAAASSPPADPHWFSMVSPSAPQVTDRFVTRVHRFHAGSESVPRKHEQCRVSGNTRHPARNLHNKTQIFEFFFFIVFI